MTAAFPNGLYILDHQIELGQRSTTLHSNIFTSKLMKKSNAEQCMIMKTFAINVTIWRSHIIQLHVHQPHAIDSVMSPPSPRQIAACVPTSIFSPAICTCTPLHNLVNHHHTIQIYPPTHNYRISLSVLQLRCQTISLFFVVCVWRTGNKSKLV